MVRTVVSNTNNNNATSRPPSRAPARNALPLASAVRRPRRHGSGLGSSLPLRPGLQQGRRRRQNPAEDQVRSVLCRFLSQLHGAFCSSISACSIYIIGRKDERTWTSDTYAPYDDGHQWRKYGEKKLSNSHFPRYVRSVHP